jgi:hypothetical protein
MCGARARFVPPTLTRTRLLWCRRGDVGSEPDCAILTRQLQQWLSSDVSPGASGIGNIITA